MAAQRSQQFRKQWKSWLIGGLLCLAALLGLIVWIRKSDPQTVIRSTFSKAGMSEKLIRWWTAIAKHETAGFTSRVYREGNNLFGMKLPRGTTTAVGELPYGERQAIFRNITDSAKDQLLYMTKRFNYPADFASFLDLVTYMKQRGYFEDSLENYYNAARKWL